MGQGEVLEFLKKQKKPVPKTVIAKSLKKSHSPIIRSLKSLYKQHLINILVIGRGNYYYYYYRGNKLKPKNI